MKEYVAFASSAVFVFLIVMSLKAYSLSCSVNATCSQVSVFRISDTTNAHAELLSQNNYGYTVCCNETNTTLGNSCSGNYTTALKLSNVTNAHVERGTYTNYANSACLSSSNGTVNCQYSSACANLGPMYTCLASMSDDTNAHVGDCNAYSTKVCCGFFADVFHNLTFQMNSSVVWWGDGLLASGKLTNINNAPINGENVSVMSGSQTKCNVTTNSSGDWSCGFSAPLQTGIYTYTANTSKVSKTAILTVAPNFGVIPSGTANRVVINVPTVMQNMDGTVIVQNVKIMVYR